ncbi:winged helix-turn-helix transcriptional regulator [Thermomonospora cellulosilytica]|uniref:DNA-binding HxlR family transcriptional regulator n=1 Tax=Thermomonospora cellulosilytica TaxID=1411118 RepID=A0A7W3MZU4_9ACTN|nr:winged helix-turn-helix transcriptional regulator [Thermomonospora cellulosilytica]MBA9004941.1 DNA-binding HxlR family transcriptional regulator [Thermomonospora cellulosilytica]
MAVSRSYGDPCGIARALDVVGERWALLVVRELLLGPKRFSDLHRGLPGASQNVLSHRLRELTDKGVIRRHRLGPPTGAWVYELTEWGRGLEPVLLGLAAWGARAPLGAGGELSVDSLVIALKTVFDARAAQDLEAEVALRLDGDAFRIRIARGELEVARGVPDRPDAVIGTDAATLRSLVFMGRPLAEAIRTGSMHVEGDRRLVERFVTLFPRPEPAPR